ncbi:MAG: hypothetical protein RL291_514 [Pseudomonadota bacterium]
MSDSATKIVLYCERSLSSTPHALWAEPLNVLSNGAYVAVGVWALLRFGDLVAVRALAILAVVVGIGSTAFHVFATRWAMIADVVPIVAFVVVAWWFEARHWPTVQRRRTLVILCAVAASLIGASSTACRLAPLDFNSLSRLPAPCLGGGLLYGAAIAAVGIAALNARHLENVARWLWSATAILTASLLARALDPYVCPLLSVAHINVTAHVAWHLGTALAMAAVIRAANAQERRATDC